MLNRFVDIDAPSKQLPPIYAHRSEKFVSIEQALQPIKTQIDELSYYIKVAKRHCHFPSEHDLSKDQSTAIYIYTMEWGDTSLNRLLNKALRSENRQALKVWFPYLKLLDTALDKLPTVKGRVWRAHPFKIGKSFSQGQLVTWWSMNSCSLSTDVIKNILGNNENATVFSIDAVTGIKVSDYSEDKNESEIILRMDTQFHVRSSGLNHPNGPHVVHLAEIDDNDDERLASTKPAMHSPATTTLDREAPENPRRNENTFVQIPSFPGQITNIVRQPSNNFPFAPLRNPSYNYGYGLRAVNSHFRFIRPPNEILSPTQNCVVQAPMHANPQTNTIYPIRQSPRNLTYFEVRQMSPTYSQPLTQYAVSNKQQQIQSPQTSQRSSPVQEHRQLFQPSPSRNEPEIIHSAVELQTTTTTEDSITKSDKNCSTKEIESELIDSKSTPNDVINEIDDQLLLTESLETVTSTQSNNAQPESITIEKTPFVSNRHSYTKEELLSKRFDPVAQERPSHLPEIPTITAPKRSPNEQFRHDVTAILDRLTPQTYTVLLRQLDALEFNSLERLKTMISIILMKAVKRAEFRTLYALLCKDLQERQISVLDENGQQVSYFFRQILSERCQKELEIEAITNDQKRGKALQQLGYIMFFGELFKLQILTIQFMYDCIGYLLEDKSDMERLECLCKLLTTIGQELDIATKGNSLNRALLDNVYGELSNIVNQDQATAFIRMKIQDLLNIRKANCIVDRAETKSSTPDRVREQESIGRGRQGRGFKQQSRGTDGIRNNVRVIVDSLEASNFTSKQAEEQVSGAEKVSEDNRSSIDRNDDFSATHSHSLRLAPSLDNSSIADSRESSRNTTPELNVNKRSVPINEISRTEIITVDDENTENDSENNVEQPL